ncbi:putative NUDIX family NTP pyrophosphohydrolase [Bradyrhizobium sp. JR7.2]|uniref:NUDIX domain-containing protein n=1 Tax=Bradyrhizobium barranii TaxID=2992140 RepID=A0ABY3R0U0_9BRAD|nr:MULTISPECIES: NUDIX domain-containing protein [Bradyrhizobium]UFW91892.1 NUDIX domain-containing protein [Bradyrhizobium japonicum]WFU00419.1 NUDIX domain-containing protein [Bradyrhizobium barranii]
MGAIRAISLPKTSAGVLLFRRSGKNVEVLLGHPGGPFWKKKDHGGWTIPKGLIAFGEAPLGAAKREFEEETGYRPGGDFIALGHAKQPGGKTVHVWATEDDWNPEELKSNTFKMEWPPRSGKYQNFPELDRASWFQTEEARERILKGQSVFLDRLNEVLSASKSGDARAK